MSGWSAGTPTGLRQVASKTATSGATVTLIPATKNKSGIILISAVLSSDVVATTTNTAWQITDVIVDDAGNQYHALQNGLAGLNQQSAVASPIDLAGIVVPPGNALKLINDPTTPAALHQCAATVVYILV